MGFDAIYLDVDGVFANFCASACRVHNFTKPITRWHFWEDIGITPREFWTKIDEDPEFWFNLEKYPWADELYSFLSTRHTVKFLTTPNHHHHSYSGKKRWLQEHYPNSKVCMMEDKEDCAKYRRLLIDDSDSNINKWQRAGGHGILFPAIWNTNARFADDPLAYVIREYTVKYNVLEYGNVEGVDHFKR